MKTIDILLRSHLCLILLYPVLFNRSRLNSESRRNIASNVLPPVPMAPVET
jgi:hypothetical protein